MQIAGRVRRSHFYWTNRHTPFMRSVLMRSGMVGSDMPMPRYPLQRLPRWWHLPCGESSADRRCLCNADFRPQH